MRGFDVEGSVVELSCYGTEREVGFSALAICENLFLSRGLRFGGTVAPWTRKACHLLTGLSYFGLAQDLGCRPWLHSQHLRRHRFTVGIEQVRVDGLRILEAHRIDEVHQVISRG